MRKIARVLLINIAVFAGLALCVEGAARIYIWATRGSGSAGLTERTRHLLYEPFLMYGMGVPWDDLFASYRRTGRFGVEDSYRVLLVGGSTAQRFPADILKSELAKRFPETDFEVINAGMGGFNARQELILLTLWGPVLKPDLIVSLTGANDVVHRLRMGRSGTFYLDDSYRSTLTHPFLAPIIEVARRSQAIQGIVRLKQRMEVRPAEVYLDAVQIFIEAQDSVDALAAGWCANRVLMLQPYRTFKTPLSPEEEAFTLYDYRDEVVASLLDRVDYALTSRGMNDPHRLYIDGRHAFDGRSEQIFSDDVHFINSSAYTTLARAIADALVDAGWAPAPPACGM
jgi:hypothetical protein